MQSIFRNHALIPVERVLPEAFTGTGAVIIEVHINEAIALLQLACGEGYELSLIHI